MKEKIATARIIFNVIVILIVSFILPHSDYLNSSDDGALAVKIILFVLCGLQLLSIVDDLYKIKKGGKE